MSDLLDQLRQLDWRLDFDPGALSRGLRYATEDRVRLLSLSEKAIETSCEGSEGRFYTQRIRLAPKGLGVVGHCSCPVNYNCKHCVAAIIVLLAQPSEGWQAPPPPVPGRILPCHGATP